MKLNYFNFEKLGDRYLLTNDLGVYYFMKEDDFSGLVAGDLPEQSQVYRELLERQFIYEGSAHMFAQKAGLGLRNYKNYMFLPPVLHIFVVTKNCNQKCIYCQASTEESLEFDMSGETARLAVDIALKSPASKLTFEFQGGEPLKNFPVIRLIVEYAEQVRGDKQIEYTIVSNLTYLDAEIADFIREHGITLSTSLDGNGELHNRNRPIPHENALELLMDRIRFARSQGIAVTAIQTTTRQSLSLYREIVDQYLVAGMGTIFLRPLTPLGYAKERWGRIGYTPEEFLKFYRNAFDYIIQCNLRGKPMVEGHAAIFLGKILRQLPQNYMELRSPCGGALGQIAYYYNGNIYTCDEARMLAEMGDQTFCLGNVHTADFRQIMSQPVCRMLAVSSCLEGLPMCADCVYSPYCGTCPVVNWAEYGTVYPQMALNGRCRIYKGILRILFEKLEQGDPSVTAVLESMAGTAEDKRERDFL